MSDSKPYFMESTVDDFIYSFVGEYIAIQIFTPISSQMYFGCLEEYDESDGRGVIELDGERSVFFIGGRDSIKIKLARQDALIRVKNKKKEGYPVVTVDYKDCLGKYMIVETSDTVLGEDFEGILKFNPESEPNAFFLIRHRKNTDQILEVSVIHKNSIVNISQEDFESGLIRKGLI